MLEIKGLYKNYGSFRALDGLDLSIPEQQIFGLVGPNGAGKTTTFKIIVGLLEPDAGELLIDGTDVLKERSRLTSVVGYMPDFFGVYDNLRVMEYLEFYGSAYGLSDKEMRSNLPELLDMVNLGEKAEAYVDGLSRGMKQRLCLARSLIHNPDILVLDEPASGMDPGNRYELKEILKVLADQGKTIIISSHILMEMAEMCTNIGIVQDGKAILQGNIDDILNAVETSNPLIINVYDRVKEAVEILKRNDQIESLSVQGNTILAVFSGGREEEALLLKSFFDQGVLIQSFSREQSNLEALFLKLTEDKSGKEAAYEIKPGV